MGFRSRAIPFPAGAFRVITAALVAAAGCEGAGFRGENPIINLSDGCTIDITPVLEIVGDEVGPGIVKFWNGRVLLEQSSHIAVFDEAGRFLQRFGRAGSGPGEFSTIQAVVPLSDSALAVVEMLPQRLTILRPDGSVKRTTLVPAMVWENAAAAVDSGTIVIGGMMLDGRSRFGSPLVSIDLADGAETYFGENEVEPSGRMMRRLVAYEGALGVVTLKTHAYEVEYWDVNGKRRGGFVREADWFEVLRPEPGRDPHEPGRPENYFRALEIDDAGRLWLIAQVTPADWRKALSGGDIDYEAWTDFMIEVVDPVERAVVCSAIFSPFMLSGFVAPGHVASYREDSGGEPTITVWRLESRFDP